MEQPTSQVNQNVGSISQPPSNNNKIVFLLGVILVLLVGFSGYILGRKSEHIIQNNKIGVKPSEIITSPSIVTPTKTNVDESEWKTYQNINLHFSIIYFSSFIPDDSHSNQGYMEFKRKNEQERALAHITILDNSSKLTAREWFDQSYQFRSSLPKDAKVSEILINGLKGLRIDNAGEIEGYNDWKAILTNDTHIAILNFALKKDEQRLTDTMLMEFKFLKQN